MSDTNSDEFWMQFALSLAESAAKMDEVPVGAIIVKNGSIVGSGWNLRERHQSPLSHAELQAIKQASANLRNWRLLNCTLYVTLEPCVMCAGAIQQSRLERVVFGTKDPKGGAFGSLFEIHHDPRLNHQISITAGVHEQRSRLMLQQFFKNKRSE